jgi:hypothetical protein
MVRAQGDPEVAAQPRLPETGALIVGRYRLLAATLGVCKSLIRFNPLIGTAALMLACGGV